MTEVESFAAKGSNNNFSGITIYFCDDLPMSTKELAKDIVKKSQFKNEIGEDVSSEEVKSSVDELISVLSDSNHNYHIIITSDENVSNLSPNKKTTILSAKDVERELLCEISRIRSSTTYEALEKSRARKEEQSKRKVSEKTHQIECDINGHISSIDKFVGRQEFIKYVDGENRRYAHSAYIPTHIANVMFKNTDQVIIQYGTHHKDLLELKPKISNFPSNVIMYLRTVKRFFSDDYVKLNTRLTDSMTDVMAHASLVNKHRQSKDSPSYNFWQDIFAYGEKMPNYHIGRLTMDSILAERFQKFVHIENYVNSVYKAAKFILAAHREQVMPVYHDLFGSKLNLTFSDVQTNISKDKIELEIDSLKEYISLQVKAINQNLTEKQQQRKHFDLATKCENYPVRFCQANSKVKFDVECKSMQDTDINAVLHFFETQNQLQNVNYRSRTYSKAVDDLTTRLNFIQGRVYSSGDKMKLAFYEDYILVLKKKKEEARRKDEYVYKFKELIPYTHITALYRDTSSSSSTYFAIICEGGTRKVLFDFRYLQAQDVAPNMMERRKQEKLLTRMDTQKQLTSFIELFQITVNDKLVEQCGASPGSAVIASIKEINFFERHRKNSWLKEGLKKGLKAVDFVAKHSRSVADSDLIAELSIPNTITIQYICVDTMMHVSPGLSRKFRGSTASSQSGDGEDNDIAGSLHNFNSLSRSQQHRGKGGFPRTGSIISINSTQSNSSRLSLMAIGGKEKKGSHCLPRSNTITQIHESEGWMNMPHNRPHSMRFKRTTSFGDTRSLASISTLTSTAEVDESQLETNWTESVLGKNHRKQ